LRPLTVTNANYGTKKESEQMDLTNHLDKVKMVNTLSLREQLGHALAQRHVVAGLRRFRQQLEKDMAPQEWTTLEAPALLLLADLCEAMSLSEQQRATVMGQRGEHALREALEVEFSVLV
jgi:hypothetical protein